MGTFAMQLTLVVVFALFALSDAKIKLTKEQMALMNSAKEMCEGEHNTPPEMIEQARRGTLVNDEGLKKFLFCFLRRIAFMKEDGTFNMAQMKMSLESALENGVTVFENCSTKDGGSGPETAFQFAQCFHDHVTDHSFEEMY